MADSGDVGAEGGMVQRQFADLPGIPSFPAAAQPDIVRANQKDDLYLQTLTDSCHDAVRSLLGPRRALQWSRETRVLAELMYYSLTTGSGAQTLGEEYCDILQVSGLRGVEPGALRRAALVLLQSCGPAIADRMLSDHSNGFSGAAESLPGAEGIAGSWHHTVQAYRAQISARWRQVAATLCRYSGVAVRAHLALFYFYGCYYHWAKRATGVRYIFMGKALEVRPSYKVLGALLFLQLGVSAGGSAASLLLNSLATRHTPPAQLGAPSEEATGRRQRGRRHAAVLDDDGKEVSSWNMAAADVGSPGEVTSARRCPLCLGARAHPTATPCGHVFCWTCIAEWGNQKPECPLCRASFSLNGLIPVYHAGF